MLLLLFFYGVVGLCLSIAALFLYRRFYAHRYFKRLDLPGPPPNWLLGNLEDFADNSKRHLVLTKWTNKYGRMYGYFEGPLPILVISDVKMVQQVFVKQFASFHGRKMFVFEPDPDTATEGVHMLYARGARWKRLRTIINPTFSAGKLRGMMPMMKRCLKDVMQVIDKNAAAGRDFDIYECYKLLTVDTISECAFGVALESAKAKGQNSPLLDNLKKVFEYSFKVPMFVIISMILPEAGRFITFVVDKAAKFLGWGPPAVMYNVFTMMESIVVNRKSNPAETRRNDLLQMMLESEADQNGNLANGDGSALKGLTMDEIKAQCFLFMAAGYETTSNALAFTTYLLAKHPEVQEKLHAEIKKHFPSEPVETNYDSVFALEYLDCVINETLRMFPIAALLTNRLAMEDTELAGVHIPAGLPIQVDVWSIHYDNDIYGPVDTSKFYPERFSKNYPSNPDRDAAGFLTFGLGPRICVGMRFALLEIKLALVEILRKYRIEKTPRTGEKLELYVAGTIMPKNGVWIKLERR